MSFIWNSAERSNPSKQHAKNNLFGSISNGTLPFQDLLILPVSE